MKDKLNYFNTIKFLSRYIKKYKKNFIIFYLGWTIDMLISIITPIILGLLIDEIVYYQNLSTFFRISIILAGILLFSCVLYFFIYAQHQYLMNIFTYDIRKDIFRHMQKCDANVLGSIATGDMISILQNYSAECMFFVIRNIIHFANGILKLIIIAVYLLSENLLIGMFILITAPLSVYMSALLGKNIRKYSESERVYYNSYLGWLHEILSSLRDIILLKGNQKVESDFNDKYNEIVSVKMKTGFASLTVQNTVDAINLFIRLVLYAAAGVLAISRLMTIGTLLSIISLLAIFIDQIGWTSSAYLDAQKRIPYIQHIYNFLNSKTENNWTGNNDLIVLKGSVVISDIEYSYPDGTKVLSNLNLKIKAGSSTAIVGRSGCGKSTLAYMLIGFYRSQAGNIVIDDQNISDCTLRSIRKEIGIVAQDILVFDASIKDNILLGNRNATMQELEEACHVTGLNDVINTLPEGIDTIIGSHGVQLSGGQKQRIALARIYLKQPSIVVFDEATSALDEESEDIIFELWNNMFENKTKIFISHRLNTVLKCDDIAVLYNGKICEQGSPQEMLQYGEKFKEIFNIG